MTKNDLVSQAYNQLNKKKESPEIKKPVFQKISLEKTQPAASNQKNQSSASNQKSQPAASSQKTQAPANLKSDLSKSRLSSSQQLDNSVNYLKTGGLLKVPVEKSEEEGKDSVYRRVAKFLLIIGEDEAAKILPHLSEAQIEKIIPEIASIRSVDKDEAQVILAEFDSLLNEARQSGGLETAREMLTKAYGEKRANEMLSKAVAFEGKKPFEYLQGADSERIYLLIKDENIGVQSLVLSNLEPKLSASVINKMTAEEKKAIVLRLAKMESVSPDVIRRVDQAMHEKSLRQTTEKAENIDGRNALAQILKKMDPASENDILSYLSEDDPDLGQDLRSRLFTMDDVVKSDDRFIQEKLRLMSEVDIAYLIAAKPDDFRDKILNNISAGRREEVLAQEDILKPMRRSDCEKITSEFFSKLRRAYEEGHLIIKDRNDDVFI